MPLPPNPNSLAVLKLIKSSPYPLAFDQIKSNLCLTDAETRKAINYVRSNYSACRSTPIPGTRMSEYRWEE